DQPLVLNGILLETSGATVTTEKGVLLDTLLLQATAPILSLKAGSNVTTNVDALDLASRVKVTSVGPVFKLDASILTIRNGAAVSVGAGSILRVTGDLLQLVNGSTLKTLNGPLLNVAGGSVVNISGALVSFGGSGGNLVSVSNSLCPCTTFSGIPVALTGGA